MPEQTNDFNKEYLEEKIQAIGEKLGDAYGQPLMEELIIRMERTVSHFNDEVDVMLALLKSRTKNHDLIQKTPNKANTPASQARNIATFRNPLPPAS